MAKGENQGRGRDQSEASRNKPNRGQDVNLHTFVHPETGDVQSGVTMRQYREPGGLQDQGYVEQAETEAVEDDTATE